MRRVTKAQVPPGPTLSDIHNPCHTCPPTALSNNTYSVYDYESIGLSESIENTGHIVSKHCYSYNGSYSCCMANAVSLALGLDSLKPP